MPVERPFVCRTMKFIGSDMERREGLIAALLELLCFVDWWKHKKWEKPYRLLPLKSDFDEIGKPASVAVQFYVCEFIAVMDFEFMIRFFIAPCACNQVYEVIDTVRDVPDFQPA